MGWWHVPIIPATWGAEAGRGHKFEAHNLVSQSKKGLGGLAWRQSACSMPKGLGSIPRTGIEEGRKNFFKVALV